MMTQFLLFAGAQFLLTLTAEMVPDVLTGPGMKLRTGIRGHYFVISE
jgi:hypothetical protein